MHLAWFSDDNGAEMKSAEIDEDYNPETRYDDPDNEIQGELHDVCMRHDVGAEIFECTKSDLIQPAKRNNAENRVCIGLSADSLFPDSDDYDIMNVEVLHSHGQESGQRSSISKHSFEILR